MHDSVPRRKQNSYGSIAHRQMKAKIHSFPTMYILGGVDVVEMGQIKVFVQELGLNIARIANAVQCHNSYCQVTKNVMNSGSQLSVL